MVVGNAGTGELVVRNPEVREGKPVLAGTRMGVHTVVAYHRLYVGDVDRILAEFPALTCEQVDAAIAWYCASDEHKAEVDTILREQRAFYDAGLAAQPAGRAADGG